MMTLAELMTSSKLSLTHKCGYVSSPSCNTPVVAHSYKVIFASKNGDLVIGQATHRVKTKARDLALQSALAWANS
jgi:hypothetical protein